MPNALTADVESRPDTLRADRFPSMRGQVQPGILRLSIQIAKRLRTGSPLVATNADPNHAWRFQFQFRSFAKDSARLFGSKMADGIKYPEKADAEITLSAFPSSLHPLENAIQEHRVGITLGFAPVIDHADGNIDFGVDH